MNEQLLERSVAERMFARQATFVEKLIATPASSTRTVERNLSSLSLRWTTLQEKHDAYVIELVSDSVELSANDALIENYLHEYARIEAACDEFVLSATPNVPTPAAAPSNNSIKLERVKFRTFDGDVRKFPKFKSEFEMYVQPLCSPCQLPFVLKSYLCDSVRREVENIDHDITAMWKRLSEKYGTVQKQIDMIMYDFKNLPACVDLSSTLRMIHLVETADSDLKCMNASSELENYTIISYIEKSMSKEMLERWAEKVIREKCDSSETKFQRLMEFLQHWKWLIEYNDADIRKSSVTSSDSTDICYADTRKPPAVAPYSATRKCLVHQHFGHPIWHCRAFKSMTATERFNLVESNNACTLCLEVGHRSSDCNMRFRCTAPHCQANHNVLLHNHFATSS